MNNETTETKRTTAQMIEGEEILSIQYAGCVGIKGGKVIQAGKVIDTLTEAKARILLDEMFYNEFGTNDISEII